MSDGVLIALIMAGIPACIAAFTGIFRAAVERGRADQYRSTTEQTISEKNNELLEQRAAITRLAEQLSECRSKLR